MAHQITHIVMAEKYLQKNNINIDYNKFFLGNIFPDIRHMGVLRREDTHRQKTSVKDIDFTKPFMAGMSFHNFIDFKMTRHFEESGIYEIYPKNELFIIAMKFICDELLYHELNHLGEYKFYFDNVLSEELDFGLQTKDVRRWHQIVSDYFYNFKKGDYVYDFWSSLGYADRGFCDELQRYIDDLNRNPQALHILSKFGDLFDI